MSPLGPDHESKPVTRLPSRPQGSRTPGASPGRASRRMAFPVHPVTTAAYLLSSAELHDWLQQSSRMARDSLKMASRPGMAKETADSETPMRTAAHACVWPIATASTAG